MGAGAGVQFQGPPRAVCRALDREVQNTLAGSTARGPPAGGDCAQLHAQPALWSRLVHNAMAEDFSWTRQVREYEALYAELAGASSRV